MPPSTSLESALKRDRILVASGLFVLAGLAWFEMAREAREMTLSGACRCAGMAMSGPDMQAWSCSQLLPLFLMWTGMMVAMMVPSAAPTLLVFAAVNRQRRQRQRPYVPVGIFLAGYLAVWTVFSAVAAVVQWALHSEALLSPMMVSTNPLLGGLLLVAAGVFQWTPLKHACLAHCRSPLNFLLTDWRDGRRGAFAMGLRHGAHCTGCCWFLMALLFVAGVMNIWWVAIISGFVLIEKLAPSGRLIGDIAGLAMAA